MALARIASAPLAALLLACGASNDPSVFGETSPTPQPSPTLLDASADHDAASDAPRAVTPSLDCPQAATLIYVTGEGNELYSFDPVAGKFALVGKLTCLSGPTHMTVDRQGVAWVVSAGKLYTASTSDASCSEVPTWTPDRTDFQDFALAFPGVPDAGATGGDLFVLGTSGKLASFDVTSGARTIVGTVPLPQHLPDVYGDMTASNDGALYFMSDHAPAQTLELLDPANAAILASYVTGENDSTKSGALAYYGGLFFDFIGPEVYTFDAATKTATSIGRSPMQVTGAGQSTCVPASAPPPAMLQ